MRMVIRGESGGAIALSILSNLFLYAAVICIATGLFGGEWGVVIVGAVLLAMAMLFGFLGLEVDTPPENRKYRAYIKWQTKMEKKGWTRELLQGSMQKTIEYYKMRPERNTFLYVSSCNPQAAQYIEAKIGRKWT